MAGLAATLKRGFNVCVEKGHMRTAPPAPRRERQHTARVFHMHLSCKKAWHAFTFPAAELPLLMWSCNMVMYQLQGKSRFSTCHLANGWVSTHARLGETFPFPWCAKEEGMVELSLLPSDQETFQRRNTSEQHGSALAENRVQRQPSN